MDGSAPSDCLQPDREPLYVGSFQQITEVRTGPLPDPRTLRELAKLYPDAPRILFEEFQSQAKHRRELEGLVIRGQDRRADRGQWIAAGLGLLGTGGTIILIGLGHGWPAALFGSTTVLSLVSTFLLGRRDQRQERVAKAELAEKMRQGRSIEQLDPVQAGPPQSA